MRQTIRDIQEQISHKIQFYIEYQNSDHHIIRKLSVFLLSVYLSISKEAFSLSRSHNLLKNEGRIFLNNFSQYQSSEKGFILGFVKSKVELPPVDDKVLMYHYNFRYNPAQIVCTLTERTLRLISISQEYWRLPDPRSSILWIDLLEAESEGSSEKDSLDDSSISESSQSNQMDQEF